MFKKRNKPTEPASLEAQLNGAAPFNPTQTRETVFNALASRIGRENADAMQLDFEKHIATDPAHGVEAGYVCMLGKLIDYVDMLNDESEGRVPAPAAASQFTVYRKDV